jgi:hypothetical protein
MCLEIGKAYYIGKRKKEINVEGRQIIVKGHNKKV